MPSNATPNYALNQWSKDDRVLMEDFNADNAKIDGALGTQAAALKSQAAALEAEIETRTILTASVAKCGDCQIYTTSYMGDGTSGAEYPITLTFDYPPVLVAVSAPGGICMVLVKDCIAFNYPSHQLVYVTWSGNTVSWYANNTVSQMSASDKVYHVTALCSKS